MNKKGFIYLVSASVLIVIIMAVFLFPQKYGDSGRHEVHQLRIKSMNDFVKGLNQDIERAMYISSFRTMVALEDYVSSSGSFLNDTEESFREAFYYGSISGSNLSLMANASIKNYVDNINLISGKLGLEVEINVTKINLSQSDPTHMDVVMHADIFVKDMAKIAYWNYSKDFKATVPLNNLRDPLYSVYTQNRISNTVRFLNTSSLVSGTNTTNLTEHINGSYYIHSTLAPNFLMRFENKIEPDPNGIESIVDIQLISDQDLDVFPNRIKVDYIYFNDLSDVKVCSVQNIPSSSNFVITTSRVSLYEIQNLTYFNSTDCP